MHREKTVRRTGLLAGMRIRKKLIFLHTCFSLSLAMMLLVLLRPAVGRIVREAETGQAMLVLGQLLAQPAAAERLLIPADSERLTVREVGPEALSLEPELREHLVASPGTALPLARRGAAAWVPDPEGGRFVIAHATIPESRRAVLHLYGFVVIALLAVYGLVAAALELFVLPQHVYGPIRRMLRAEQAVQEGRSEEEVIPEAEIPADELGEIMRSRNASITALRRHERDLADALGRLEAVANDLRRKNHLLETARQNLADAGRLASLGMMSAGIAHELNTPLAVVKGLVERLASRGGRNATEEETALLLRVVGRLERLSESLLDFARVRPPSKAPTRLAPLVSEAMTLVRLDRALRATRLVNRVPDGLVIEADADRILQVLVNLIRNSVDAVQRRGGERTDPGASGSDATVEVHAELTRREDREWVSVRVVDDGPGIDPEVLSKIFEPFVSTRLDAEGTGLGLAVAEGIVREHGGVLLARNRPGRSGAEFEIMLPLAPGADVAPAPPDTSDRLR